MENQDFRSRRSFFWPLLLIVLGVIFLLNTLGVIQGDAWDLFIRLWPLLFILGGLDHLIRGEGWVWGIISLGLGTVFLLANFGYLPWNAFNMLLRLWPLLLIAIGLDLVFKGRSPAATLIGVVLAVAIVGGITWFAVTNTAAAGANVEQIVQPLNEARRGEIRISNPVGRLEIQGDARPDVLLEGSAALARQQELEPRYNLEEGTARYTLSSSGIMFFPWSGGFSRPTWEFKLNESVPLGLDLNTGAGDQVVDLRGLDVERLNISVAVGQLELTLPEDDQFSGRISNPIGSIVIYVPRGALVEFQTETALSVRDVPEGFTINGNLVYSPGATAANARVRLTIEKPIGRLSIRALP